MVKLYHYKLSKREGLILEKEGRYSEIAPLPNFSKESLPDALHETLQWIRTNKEPTLPSVRWGISCLQKEIGPIHLPLCALGVKEGFSTIKLKLGHLNLDDAIALVQKHLGKFRLRLDFNRKWALAEALEFVKHFKKEDFEYLEEPVQSFEELVEFSKLTGFPVALDESIHSDWSKVPSLRAIVVKPMIVGMVPDVPEHLNLILSSAYESGVGLLHIANCARGEKAVGLDTVHEEDILTKGIRAEAGRFSWSGEGVMIDKAKLCWIA